MKKIVLTFVAVMMVSSMALAAGGNTGCGLGTMLFGQSELGLNTVLTQILAVTTNGTSGNQTFGITSGTSDCDQPSKWVSNEQVNKFVLANMDDLAKDIAAGQGETVSPLAELMEVPAESRDTFYSTLQANFDQIFPHPDVNYAHVVDTVGLIAQQV